MAEVEVLRDDRLVRIGLGRYRRVRLLRGETFFLRHGTGECLWSIGGWDAIRIKRRRGSVRVVVRSALASERKNARGKGNRHDSRCLQSVFRPSCEAHEDPVSKRRAECHSSAGRRRIQLMSRLDSVDLVVKRTTMDRQMEGGSIARREGPGLYATPDFLSRRFVARFHRLPEGATESWNAKGSYATASAYSRRAKAASIPDR